MKTPIAGYAKVGLGITVVLFTIVDAWFHSRFPVYNKRQVTSAIEHNIPIGTNQVQAIDFLGTLKKQGVYYEGTKTSSDVAAYFPETMFYMRGWRCILAQFTFKKGKLASYEVRRVSI